MVKFLQKIALAADEYEKVNVAMDISGSIFPFKKKSAYEKHVRHGNDPIS